MANTSEVAARAAVPTGAEIERAAAFAREPFLLDGEGPEALAEGTARRRGLDAALAEIEAGAEYPSIQWRRDFSLLLGLERLLADEPPKLLDGAELNPHQVDALSGTLTELMAEQQTAAEDDAELLIAEEEDESAGDPDEVEEPIDEAEERRRGRGAIEARRRRRTRRSPRTWRPRRSRRTGRSPPPRRTPRTSSRSPRTIQAPSAAFGSSTRPAPARPSPPSASSRPRGPAAS